MEIAELVDRYCGIWGEPDGDRRAAQLNDLWANGASYSDPSVVSVGSAALLSHIAAARARWPGLRIRRTSAVDHHHDVARFAGMLVQPMAACSWKGWTSFSLPRAAERSAA